MREISKHVIDRQTLKSYYVTCSCTMKVPGSLRTEKGVVYLDDEGNAYCMSRKEFDRRFKCAQ